MITKQVAVSWGPVSCTGEVGSGRERTVLSKKKKPVRIWQTNHSTRDLPLILAQGLWKNWGFFFVYLAVRLQMDLWKIFCYKREGLLLGPIGWSGLIMFQGGIYLKGHLKMRKEWKELVGWGRRYVHCPPAIVNLEGQFANGFLKDSNLMFAYCLLCGWNYL